VTEGPFDHLELSAGDNSLPDAVQTALWDIQFRRIEIGPIEGAPAKTYAVRLDGNLVHCSDDASVPRPLRVLFNYLDGHGVTPPLLDYIRDQNRQAAAVESLSRPLAVLEITPAEAAVGQEAEEKPGKPEDNWIVDAALDFIVNDPRNRRVAWISNGIIFIITGIGACLIWQFYIRANSH